MSMSLVRGAAQRLSLVPGTQSQVLRGYRGTAGPSHGPPRNRITLSEKWVMFFAITAGIAGPCMYFNANVKYYTGNYRKPAKWAELDG